MAGRTRRRVAPAPGRSRRVPAFREPARGGSWRPIPPRLLRSRRTMHRRALVSRRERLPGRGRSPPSPRGSRRDCLKRGLRNARDIAAAPWEAGPSAYCRQADPVTREDADAPLGASPVQDPAVGVDGSCFYLSCRQHGQWLEEVTALDPHTDDAWFDPRCPIRNVPPSFLPTTRVHGEAETNGPHTECERFAARLAAEGVQHHFPVRARRASGRPPAAQARSRRASCRAAGTRSRSACPRRPGAPPRLAPWRRSPPPPG